MLTEEQMRDALRQCPHDTVENLRVRWLYAKDFARAIESAACAERDARIAELERQLEEARKDEREHWENACRLMLVARSGQITDMALAERLVGLISEDRKEKQAIRAAIKEQT